MIYMLVIFIPAFFISFDKYDDLGDIVIKTLLKIEVSFIIGGVIWLTFGGVIGSKLPQEEVVYEHEDIYALSDSAAVSGSGFLLAGTIGEKLVYRYVTEDVNKGKVVKKLNASECYITEDSTVAPYVEKIKIKFKNPIYTLFASRSMGEDYYKLVLPKDSIVEDYTIDLK